QMRSRFPRVGRRGLWAAAVAVLLTIIATAAYQLAWPPVATPDAKPKAAAPREALVPEAIPYIASRDQAAIRAVYMSAPDHKAIAINSFSIGVSLAQPDRESAAASARATCEHGEDVARDPCEIYAIDNEVVFGRGRPQLPSQPWVVNDPTTARPFVPAEVPLVSDAQRKLMAGYAHASTPKALAVGETPTFIWHGYQASVDDAVRRA